MANNNRIDWRPQVRELILALQKANNEGDEALLEVVFTVHEDHVPQRQGSFLLKVDSARTTEQPPSAHWNCRKWEQLPTCKIRRLHAPGLEARQISLENGSMWTAAAVVVKQVVGQVHDAGDDMIDDSMELKEIWPVVEGILIHHGRNNEEATVNLEAYLTQTVEMSPSGTLEVQNPATSLNQMPLANLSVLQTMAKTLQRIDEKVKDLK